MSSLDPTEVRILQILAQNARLTAAAIHEQVGIHQVKVDYYLNKLVEAGFITGIHFYTGRRSAYLLDQRGREYLIKNDLLD